MAATLVEFNQSHSFMVGLSNTSSNDKLFKEVDSSEEKSTGIMVKGIDSTKVARADVQANEVAGPSQRVKEVSTFQTVLPLVSIIYRSISLINIHFLCVRIRCIMMCIGFLCKHNIDK